MKISVMSCLLITASLVTLGGCGNIKDNSGAVKPESKEVEAAVSYNTADELSGKEFKCFYSGTPDEKYDVAADKPEEFSECYENMKNNWELVSESTAEEMSDTYGGLYYVVETYSEGEIVSQMYLINNIDANAQTLEEYSEVMLFDKQTDTVRTMKCDNGDYSKIYQLVQNSI